jgi:hypothetical protein
MQHLFVTYEIAKKLKELGFDRLCFTYFFAGTNDLYNGTVRMYNFNKGLETSAPLWQQAIDWFYDNHEILIVQIPSYSMKVWEVSKKGNKDVISGLSINKAIEEAIKLI